jgi:nicotinamide-nucleotide amidase
MELYGTPCYALPGVPFEMRAMFAQQVAPQLRASGAGRVLVSRELFCFGQSEADIGARLSDLLARGRNPEVGTTAELGVIGIRLNAAAETPQAAETLLNETEREIRTRLGEVVFGRDGDTLATVVGELLAKRGETLCTAESCTGGLIGKYLTDVPGSSRYFLGGIVSYSNDAKQRLLDTAANELATHGAVSQPVARAMATGARTRFASDYALAVTGIAGPTGGTQEKPVGLVYIALAGPQEVLVREFRFGRDAPREMIRERAARTALNLLRLELLAREPGGASGTGPRRGGRA